VHPAGRAHHGGSRPSRDTPPDDFRFRRRPIDFRERRIDNEGVHDSPDSLESNPRMYQSPPTATRQSRTPWVAGLLVGVTVACCAQPGHGEQDAAAPPPMQRVRVADRGEGFVLADSGERFLPWGFNFVGDFGRIVEEYWREDWPSVEKDFRQMRELGANVVRLHLQVGTYMKTETEVDRGELQRLRRILDLGTEHGLYLDLTGLGCYHLKAVPPWYDAMSESERWKVQARFWEAVAETCAGHPAVFCYDLMNEPVITEAKQGEHPWLAGELEGFYFVQRICNDPKDRDRNQIAADWAGTMVRAIKKHDREHLVTVGVIPWAQVWPGAKPVFYSPAALEHFDFVSVHFYPKSGEVDKALKALAVYDLGKPLVVEEIFPLSCSLDEMNQFIDGSAGTVDGWISHYFGRSIQQHAEGAEPSGPAVAKFLEYWREKGVGMTRAH
jgi:hypothetical protein